MVTTFLQRRSAVQTGQPDGANLKFYEKYGCYFYAYMLQFLYTC